jgi:AmmeMemoRadiSam system protein B
MNESYVRESVVAGSFYPSNPETLKKTINQYIEKAETEIIHNVKGLVCPHAGYIYSGQVAAYSYKQLKDRKIDCIFIIAPSHSEYFDFNSVFPGSAYKTPLGSVKVDSERAETLVKGSDYPANIRYSDYGHRREHSLEVQLPFLQTVLTDFKIVPIVMGSQVKDNIESLGSSIGNLFTGQNIAVIASTDLSHYHPYNDAASLDKSVIDYIEDFNNSNFKIEDFTDAITSQEVEMCGGGPVASVMVASKILGADKSKVLQYKNSGDVSGDRNAVVGYLSAAFF